MEVVIKWCKTDCWFVVVMSLVTVIASNEEVLLPPWLLLGCDLKPELTVVKCRNTSMFHFWLTIKQVFFVLFFKTRAQATWPNESGVHRGGTRKCRSTLPFQIVSQLGLTFDIYGSILIPSSHWSAASVTPPTSVTPPARVLCLVYTAHDDDARAAVRTVRWNREFQVLITETNSI